MTTRTFRRGTDTNVRSVAPNTSYVTARKMAVGLGAAYGFVHFARPAPLGATVTSATLRVHSTSLAGVGTATLRLRQVAPGWLGTFSAMTWNTRPGVTGTIVESSAARPVTGGRVWEFNVTAFVQVIADGGFYRGWRIESTVDDGDWSVFSFDSELPASLEVAWSDAPDAPSRLSPAGGRAVSISHPVLRMDYADVSGNRELAAVQVQISATDSFTTPAFDSGTVASTAPELRLAATTYVGVAVGATVWWRTRVQDGAGLWSAWSVPTSFRRVAKQALSITSPATDGGTFGDATLPVTWDSPSQVAYQVIIATDPVDEAGQWLHDTGKVTSTVDAYTLPKGVIRGVGTRYLVVVRTWDATSRESTPGDPPWTSDRKSVTYRPWAARAAVSDLTAVEQDRAGRVEIRWSRSVAPDAWLVLRDDQVVDSALTVADSTTGGTTYWFRDAGATPRREHTWQVLPVVNGEPGSSGPLVTLTTRPVGLWLIEPDRPGFDVLVMEPKPLSATFLEQATAHEPMGAEHPVLITQGMGGYVGTVTGWLFSDAQRGITTYDWKSRLLRLKSLRPQNLRIVGGDLNFPAVIHHVNVGSEYAVEVPVFPVSFEFYQTGEFEYVTK